MIYLQMITILIIHFRPLFKELKLSGEKHIILDYDVEHIMRILGQAEEVHFMGDYQSYVITNLVSKIDVLQKYITHNITHIIYHCCGT
jgi:hypothetical protein